MVNIFFEICGEFIRTEEDERTRCVFLDVLKFTVFFHPCHLTYKYTISYLLNFHVNSLKKSWSSTLCKCGEKLISNDVSFQCQIDIRILTIRKQYLFIMLSHRRVMKSTRIVALNEMCMNDETSR